MITRKKGAVVVVDEASRSFSSAIHALGLQAGFLQLTPSRILGNSPAPELRGFDFFLDATQDGTVFETKARILKTFPAVVGLIPAGETSESKAIELARHLNLLHNPAHFVSLRRNKAKVKELARAAGLRVPGFRVCYTSADIEKTVQEFSCPLIIKTPEGTSGHNVFKCFDERSLIEKHEIIMNTKDNWQVIPTHSVIEEYIGGIEYHISTFSNGKETVVTDLWEAETIDTKFATNLFYQCSLVRPSDPKLAEVVKYAIEITKATGIKYGPGYMQVKVDDKGPALIETHARFGGGWIPEIIEEISNFDPFAATVKVFTEGFTAVPKKIYFTSHFAIVACPSIWSCEKGRTVGVEEIRRLPSFFGSNLKSDQYLNSVQPTTHLGNFPLTVCLRGSDQKQVHKDIQQVHKLFKITCC